MAHIGEIERPDQRLRKAFRHGGHKVAVMKEVADRDEVWDGEQHIADNAAALHQFIDLAVTRSFGHHDDVFGGTKLRQ